MNWLIIISLIIWIYMLTVFRRGKLDFWFYITGSVGFFIFMLVLVEPFLVEPMQKAVAAAAGFFGKITGMYQSFFQKGIIFISHGETNLSLYIDFECSGIIETMAFLALLWFFPVYRIYERVVISILGGFAIFGFNILRIFVICAAIYWGGMDLYFFAHTILGRIVFYACTVTLYFQVFTRAQISRQKVGGFRYDSNQ